MANENKSYAVDLSSVDPTGMSNNNQDSSTYTPPAVMNTLPRGPQLPPPPKNANDDLNMRLTTFDVMSHAQYQTDLLNAGNDPFLQGIAQQKFILNQSKVASWHKNLSDKFGIIAQDDTLTPVEKEMVRNAIMNRSQDPIYVPQLTSFEEKLTPQQKARKTLAGLGVDISQQPGLSVKANKSQQPLPGTQTTTTAVKESNSGYKAPKTQAEYDAIPEGTVYRDTDGKLKTKGKGKK